MQIDQAKRLKELAQENGKLKRFLAKTIEVLADVVEIRGVPQYLCSDNGLELLAKDLRKWLADTGA